MTNTINYRTDIMGEYIDNWYVIEGNNGNEPRKSYKTEAGALKRYNELDHAILVRETTVVGQDVTVAAK
jgi:hypothetical protein